MDENRIDIPDLLNALFDDALNADEFEYCCTLLRIRGEEPLAWDPLRESIELIQQVMSLVESPVERSFRLRLLLFLYCHATEMHDLYAVPMNLLRIVTGGRYSLLPFYEGQKSEPKYPSQKVKVLSRYARQKGYTNLADLYEWMLVPQVRNAFFHSDYAISDSEFIIYSCRGVEIEGEYTNVIPWQWLLPRLQTGINLAIVMIRQLYDRRAAYKEEKIVRPGRVEGFGDVKLIVGRHGLLGFSA